MSTTETQTTAKAAAEDLERRALLPGVYVDVPELGAHARVRIVPVGWKHLRQSMGAIARVVAIVLRNAGQFARLTATKSEGEATAEVIGLLMPTAIEELFELVEACTVLENVEVEGATLGDVPAARAATIIGAWAEESFGAGKWKPWATAIETTVRGITGKPFSIKETLSKLASRSGTTGTTSSTAGNPG